MNRKLEIMMDDNPVTFTTGGKVNLLEAICAISGTDAPEQVWETLKRKNPGLEEYVEYTRVSGKKKVPVTGSRGWERIQTALFDHVLDISD